MTPPLTASPSPCAGAAIERCARHSAARSAWRSLIKIAPHAGGADRRDAAAGDLPDASSPTSSAARSPTARSTTTCSSCSPACWCRSLAFGARRDRRQPQHRHQEGRLRPLPLAADRAVGAAGRRGRSPTSSRYALLTAVMLGFGYADRLPDRRPACSSALAASRWRSGSRCAFCWISVWVGMLGPRRPARCRGSCFLLVFPLTFGTQHVRRPADTLPGWLQAFVDVNPLTQLVDAVRAAAARRPGGRRTCCGRWLSMAGLLAVFAPLALRAYRRRA